MKWNHAMRATIGAASEFREKVVITPKRIDNGVAMLSGIFNEYQAI